MTTTFDQFESLRGEHPVVPVTRTLLADSESPIALYRKLADSRPGSFLLESAEQGGIFSRYSFIGVRSYGILTTDGGSSQWRDLGLSRERALGVEPGSSPLDDVRRLHARWSAAPIPGLPPLTGGLVGFIGWDAVREFEHLPSAPPADLSVPAQALCFVAELVAIDHRTGDVHLIVSSLTEDQTDALAVWTDAQKRLDALEHALRAPATPVVSERPSTVEVRGESQWGEASFVSAVERSKTFIVDGDVFQVVLSQRFDVDCVAEPIDVYRVLRTLNPSPYMYLLSLESDAGPYSIVGSSPEALVKVSDGRALTHPIAGSRPRGETPELDQQLEAELLADPKERAEHLMLVDLARNDLARVCQPGSVEVSEFMRIERFSHIMHIVSSVEGRVRDGVSLVDVFGATFPAGTLSGAPKPRALEIIDELEPVARGIYGGVVGYFDFAGNADLAICIRTALIANGRAHVQAGAGLVADSVPASENAETRTKASAVLRAIAIANGLRS
ncbi:MAG TPA: anthranilate synthase component I [Microbacteriaceae bacterium]|nr:anthranilate synthase component I [Microbacteriaceae bacterium]